MARQKIGRASAYLRNANLPPELQQRVREHLQVSANAHTGPRRPDGRGVGAADRSPTAPSDSLLP
eukprot:4571433-Prymnesium_polylepis.1